MRSTGCSGSGLGARRFGGATLLAISCFLATGGASAVAQVGEIYFSEDVFNDTRLKVVGLDGSGPTPLFAMQPETYHLRGTVIDPEAGLIFWRHATAGFFDVIAAAHPDGTGQYRVSRCDSLACWSPDVGADLCIDRVGKRLYWIDPLLGTVASCDYQGLDYRVVLATTIEESVTALAVDGSAGKLYVGTTGGGPQYGLERMNTDGSGRETVVGRIRVSSIAADSAHDRVFWSNLETQTVSTATLSGAGVQTLFEGVAWDLEVDPFGQRLYWIEGADPTLPVQDGQIRSRRTDGTDPATIYTPPAGYRVTSIDLVVAPCNADCDQSTGPGVLDFFDFICFQDRFASGDPYACDCDTSSGPSVCDFFDFICFQDLFAAGC